MTESERAVIDREVRRVEAACRAHEVTIRLRRPRRTDFLRAVALTDRCFRLDLGFGPWLLFQLYFQTRTRATTRLMHWTYQRGGRRLRASDLATRFGARA